MSEKGKGRAENNSGFAIIVDSFSGAVADIPRRQRTPEKILRALDRDPHVSTWDMDEGGLWSWIRDLEREGFITSLPCGYPWLQYELTDKGKNLIKLVPLSLAESPISEMDGQIQNFEHLLETLESGDTEAAAEWIRAAIKMLERRRND